MEIILKDADFSQNGIVEPVNAQFQQGRPNILTGTMGTGTGIDYNRSVDLNYYNRRTTIKNIGSALFDFIPLFYDANKNYIGYGTMKATGEGAASVGLKALAVGESCSIYDFARYLDMSNGQWSSDTFNPENAVFFRMYLYQEYSENYIAQISK